MALSAFEDKSKEPQKDELTKVLSRSAIHWVALVEQVEADYPPLDQSWGYSGAAWGWALRLRQKKRTIMYLTPCKGYFLVGFALGEKAVRAAHSSGLKKSTLDIIDSAKKYAEGRGVRIEVRTKRDRDDILKLASIKMEN